MKEKDILSQLEEMRVRTEEAIKWLEVPAFCRKNLEALENAIQIIKEYRKSATKIRQLQRSLRAKRNRSVRAWNGHASYPQGRGIIC